MRHGQGTHARARARTHEMEAMLERAPEATISWFVAWAAGIVALTALLPDDWLRVAVGVTALALAIWAAPSWARHTTPTAVVAIIVVTPVLTMASAMLVSHASWTAGLAVSRSGGSSTPGRWLFTVGCLALAAGLLPASRLMLRAGQRAGDIGATAFHWVSLLPPLSSLAWVVVGTVPVGVDPMLDTLHTDAAIVAMGAFWLGMIATLWAPRISASLRRFALVSAVIVFVTWLPTELKILGIIVQSPVKTLYMQGFVAALSAIWLIRLAHEWQVHAAARATASDATR